MNNNFEGHQIVKLLKSGLDTGILFEDVQRLYKTAERRLRENNPKKAIELCRRALRMLQDASSRTTGDLSAIPYSRGKSHLLLASIYLNENRDLGRAKKHYLQSKDAFGSRKKLPLEGLAYLGLAITQRKLAVTQNKSEFLDEAIDACYRAQNSVEQEGIPDTETVNIDALMQAIKVEKATIENLLSAEDLQAPSTSKRVLAVFDIAAGRDILAEESTTDLNLLLAQDYDRHTPAKSKIFDLVQFPLAQSADYVLEVGAVDRTEGSLQKGDWIFIQEENDLESIHGRKVAVLMMARTENGIETYASLKEFFIGRTKSSRNPINHYFLKAIDEKSPSIIASHFSSPTRSIDKYYAEYKKSGPVEEKFVYDLRVSGIVLGEPVSATVPEAVEPPSPYILKIPIVSDIAAGLGVIAKQNIEEFLELREEEHKGADFGVRVVGDSMTGHGIFPGDIALIRKQPEVEMGEIAAIVLLTPEAKEGVLKQFYEYDKREDMLHWLLKSSNPASKHLIVTPRGVDVEAIEELYATEIQAGRMQKPIIYRDAEIAIAGKYVGLSKKE